MLPVSAHRKLLFHLLSYRLPSAFTDLVGPWELDHAEETQLKQNDSRKAPVLLWCGCTSASSKTVASERAADALHHSQHLFFTGKPMLLPVWASGCMSAPMEYRDRFVISSAAEELEGHSIWAASPYSSANLFIKMLALQGTSAPLQEFLPPLEDTDSWKNYLVGGFPRSIGGPTLPPRLMLSVFSMWDTEDEWLALLGLFVPKWIFPYLVKES